jgi:hypothetical protein
MIPVLVDELVVWLVEPVVDVAVVVAFVELVVDGPAPPEPPPPSSSTKTT